MLRLDLIVGPNGAGRSTIVGLVLGRRIPGSVFVNADLIAAQRWPQDPAGHAYEAAEIAAATRSALIAAGQPFIAETVFPPIEVDLVREAQVAGYTVILHVVLVTEDLAVERVAHCARAGGHDVPGTRSGNASADCGNSWLRPLNWPTRRRFTTTRESTVRESWPT